MSAIFRSGLHRTLRHVLIAVLAGVGASANAQIFTECPDPEAVYATAWITGPASGSDFYPAAQSVTLSAVADASGARVDGIQLRTGSGAFIGTIPGGGGSLVWSGLGAGTYTVYATPSATSQYAYCLVNIYPSAAINFTVSPYVPSAVAVSGAVTGPAPATVSVAASISGRNPITRVDFLVDGAVFFSRTSPPYIANKNGVGAGVHSVQAIAHDVYGGASPSSTPLVTVAPNPPPTVGISVTSNSMVAPATVVLDATASDPLGIQRVEFRTGTTLLSTDTAPPYQFTWTGVAAGTYSVFARAVNGYGTSSDSVARSVTVTGVSPPTPINPPGATGAIGGTLPGAVTVDPSGATAYSVPLALPPGTAGMAPQLALQYSSRGGEGMVGHGWSVAGISSITRCGKTKATDALASGVKTRVNLDGTDQYCLDGQRLILVSGTLGGTGEFRTEIDGFSRIQSFGGDSAKGPDRWEVRDKDGSISSYGTTADSTFAAQGRSPALVLSWMLSRVEDRRGTYYTVSYTQNLARGEIYPSTIRYSGNGTAIVPYNAVDFVYDAADRPDPLSGYVVGAEVSVRKRLNKIRVRVDTAADGSGGIDTREYRLAYTQNPTSQRSLVQSVTDCARSQLSTSSPYECLPPTSFSYQQRTSADNHFNAPGSGVWPGLSLEMPYEIRYLISQSGGLQRAYWAEAREWVNVKSVFADFNGDGRLDNAYSNGSGVWQVCLSTGSSFDCQSWDGPAADSAHVLIGDFDGDGKADIVAPPAIGGPQEANFNVCLSTGSSFNCQAWGGGIASGNPVHWYYFPNPPRGGPYSEPSPYKVLDVNGDGRDDYVIKTDQGGNGYACLSTGVGFTCSGFTGLLATEGSSACPPDLGGCSPYDRHSFGVASGDVNGDGRTDFALNSVDESGAVWRFCTTGDNGITCLSAAPEVPGYNISPTPAATGGTLIANINHDGVDTYGDLFIARGYDSQLCRSTGNAFLCTQLPPGLDDGDYNIVTLADFDSDGRVDALGYNFQRQTFRLCQLGGTYRCTDWSGPQIGAAGLSVSQAVPFHLVAWRVGDFNGDGRPDIAVYNRNSDQWSIYLAAAGPTPDLLASVTNGVGHQTQINYGTLQDAAIYSPDSTATYPNRVVRDATPVVSNVQAANGVGGWLATSYRYGGAKFSQDGRGFLGFGWFEATDSVSNVITRTEVSQSFPTIGMPTLISGNHFGGVEIRRIDNSPTSRITANEGTAAPKSYFPYISRSVETSREMNNGNLVSTVTADPMLYDAYGNETDRTTIHFAGGEGYSEIASTVYSNDVASWLLGRPIAVTTIRTAPGVANITRQRTMAYTALGELEVETIEPSGSPDLRLQTTPNREPTTGVVTSKAIAWTEAATGAGWPEDGTGQTRTVETLVFDPRLRYPTTVRNALNHHETRAYDPRNGSVTSLTGPNNLTTTWQYDGFGRRVRETRADGTYSTTRYSRCESDCGTATLLTLNRTFNGANGQITVPTVKYSDPLLREVKWQSWTFDGRERIAARVHDSRGRLASKARARFASGDPTQWTYFAYDDLGRATEINDPATGISTTAHDGLTTVHTNSKSQTRSEVRNALGKLRTVTDNHAQTTTYRYDSFGNLARVTDPLGNQINVTYDRLGRKTRLSDPNLGTWSYVLNALGEARSQTDAANQTIRSRYDALGRLQQRLAPDLNAHWTYDTGTKGIGKLAEAYTLTGTSTRDYERLHLYDTLGRLSRSTVRLEYDYVTDSSYDTNGRMARTTYQRNPIGGSGGTSVAVDYRYNSNGYLDQLSLGPTVLWSVNQQDALDRITRQTFGNGVITRRDFDPTTARLTGIVAGLPVSGQPSGSVQTDSYLYDRIGNLEYRTQLDDGSGLLQESFGYDGLNRLTSAQAAGQPVQIYGYNELGNLTTKTGVGTYSYPASGAGSVRPHAIASIAGSVAGVNNPTFSYDNNGNLLNGLGRTLTWSSHQLPLSITKASGAGPGSAGSGSATNLFVYGPELQRIKQTISANSGPNAGTTTHWYASGFERETRTVDNTTQVRMFLPQGVVIVDRYPSAGANITTAAPIRQLRYYAKDRLGSTIAVTGDAGAVLERQFYDPWGQRRNGDGSPSTTLASLDHRYGYTEHEMLDAIGLVHMNGRIYDPLLGRFMSADPTVPDPSDGQNYNRYSYVLNNPHVYTDPSGFAQMFQMDHQPGLPMVGTLGGAFGGAFNGFGLSLNAMFEIPSLESNRDPNKGGVGSICPTTGSGCTAFIGGLSDDATRPKTVEEKLAQAVGQTNQTPQKPPQPDRVPSDVPTGFSCSPGTQCLERVEIIGERSQTQRISDGVSRVSAEIMRMFEGLQGLPQVAGIGAGIRLTRAGIAGSKVARATAEVATAANYRARFVKARPDLPSGWPVHHSMPQRYDDLMHAEGVNIHDLQYLRGMSPQLHSRITTDWERFHGAAGGNPSAARVAEFAKHIDKHYGGGFLWPGF